MSTVAYLYLPTPAAEDVPSMLEHMAAVGISISHFGIKDPPKRWSGATDEMVQMILKQPELNKWAFIRDASKKLELDLQLMYDSRCSHSTISIRSSIPQTVESLAERLSATIKPYLCILGTLGFGKTQDWRVLYERSDCPSEVRVVLNAA